MVEREYLAGALLDEVVTWPWRPPPVPEDGVGLPGVLRGLARAMGLPGVTLEGASERGRGVMATAHVRVVRAHREWDACYSARDPVPLAAGLLALWYAARRLRLLVPLELDRLVCGALVRGVLSPAQFQGRWRDLESLFPEGMPEDLAARATLCLSLGVE